MPDHVHLLVTVPERGNLAVAVQMLKQIVSRQIVHPGRHIGES
jgi:REP element-mobilizing transposase RayT